MADLSTHSQPAAPGTQNHGTLLATLTRWWSPAEATPSIDAELGYESALPWTLSDKQDAYAYD